MTIIVCPMSRAPEIAHARRPSHAVSLLDPGSSFPVLVSLADARHLRLGVHDINEAADGQPRCSAEQMRTILNFTGGWDRSDPMLIHCYAGISRSTATAFITACLHNPDADERDIAWTLRKASPTAFPNRRFVDLADAQLGRDGRMSRAIVDIGDGALWHEIGEAKPFELPSHFEPAGR